MSDNLILKIFETKASLEKDKYISTEAFNNLFSLLIDSELHIDKLNKQLNYALQTGGDYLEIKELVQ